MRFNHLAISTSLLIGAALPAQTPAPYVPAPALHPTPGVDYRSAANLEAIAKQLLANARAADSGSASVVLDKTPTHFTMLAARVKSGGAELHKKYADLFVVLSGEATEITGGTIADPKGEDEVRGSRVEGGTSQVLRTGDTILIPANTPHQTTVAPGATFTYYVVKVPLS